MELYSVNNNSSINKSFRKWVRVNDDDYDYYIDITKINIFNSFKGIYKYENKTMPAYIFNKSNFNKKSDFYVYILTFIIVMVLAAVNTFFGLKLNTTICLVSLAIILVIHELIYVFTNVQLKRRLKREKYFKATIAVEYEKITQKQKTKQELSNIIYVITILFLPIASIFNFVSNFFSLICYLYLLFCIVYIIRLFPKKDTVDYILIKDE